MFTRTMENNVYIIDVTMEKLEDGAYKTAIQNYGEESINIGGEILSEEDAVLAVLSDKYIKISELPEKPVRQRFSATQYGEKAKETAVGWYEATQEKILDYVNKKAGLVDDFTADKTIYFE